MKRITYSYSDGVYFLTDKRSGKFALSKEQVLNIVAIKDFLFDSKICLSFLDASSKAVKYNWQKAPIFIYIHRSLEIFDYELIFIRRDGDPIGRSIVNGSNYQYFKKLEHFNNRLTEEEYNEKPLYISAKGYFSDMQKKPASFFKRRVSYKFYSKVFDLIGLMEKKYDE